MYFAIPQQQAAPPAAIIPQHIVVVDERVPSEKKQVIIENVKKVPEMIKKIIEAAEQVKNLPKWRVSQEQTDAGVESVGIDGIRFFSNILEKFYNLC